MACTRITPPSAAKRLYSRCLNEDPPAEPSRLKGLHLGDFNLFLMSRFGGTRSERRIAEFQRRVFDVSQSKHHRNSVVLLGFW